MTLHQCTSGSSASVLLSKRVQTLVTYYIFSLKKCEKGTSLNIVLRKTRQSEETPVRWLLQQACFSQETSQEKEKEEESLLNPIYFIPQQERPLEHDKMVMLRRLVKHLAPLQCYKSLFLPASLFAALCERKSFCLKTYCSL